MKGVNIYILFLSLIFLNASHAYATITWMPGTWLAVIGLMDFILFLLSYRIQYNYLKYAIIAYFLMCVGGFLAFGFTITAFAKLAAFLPVITLFLLRYEDLKKVLASINKIFAVLISISFLLYILKTLGLPLPSLGHVVYGEGFVYSFDNYYYIYLDVPMYGIAFNGFSLEPGYFSLLLVCLLLVNEFDYTKKSTWLYTICILFSFSLEGYLLLVVGFIMQKSLEKGNIKDFVKYSLASILVLAIVVIIAFNYNNGDNIIVEEILSRLAFDEDLGIVGNNRESEVAKDIIDNIFYSSQVWKGIGHEALNEAQKNSEFTAASGRVFIVVYGAIYTIIYFFLSFKFLKKTEIKITLPFFVIFWLDFLVHGDLYTESMYLLIMFMLYHFKGNHKIIQQSEY